MEAPFRDIDAAGAVHCNSGLLACVNASLMEPQELRKRGTVTSDECHRVIEFSDGDESLSTQCMAACIKHKLADSRLGCSACGGGGRVPG